MRNVDGWDKLPQSFQVYLQRFIQGSQLNSFSLDPSCQPSLIITKVHNVFHLASRCHVHFCMIKLKREKKFSSFFDTEDWILRNKRGSQKSVTSSEEWKIEHNQQQQFKRKGESILAYRNWGGCVCRNNRRSHHGKFRQTSCPKDRDLNSLFLMRSSMAFSIRSEHDTDYMCLIV